MGGHTSTGDSLNDRVWKTSVAQDTYHWFLKQSVIPSLLSLVFKTVNDHKHIKPGHFSNSATISASFGLLHYQWGLLKPESRLVCFLSDARGSLNTCFLLAFGLVLLNFIYLYSTATLITKVIISTLAVNRFTVG